MLALLLSLIGCGGDSQQITPQAITSPIAAAQVFSNVAETWTFQNGFGDITWIDVMPQADGSSIWHYRKNADRSYWMPGGQSAELYFFLAKDSSGAWYSTGGHIIAPFGYPWDSTHVPQDFTYTVSGVPSHPRPYLILADSGTVDDTVFPDVGLATARWTTKMYVQDGFLISEQWEGPCIHEKWWFKPGAGLWKVEPLDQGSCFDVDPRLNMQRIS